MGDNKNKAPANTPTEERQEHISIIPVSQEVVIDKCVADNCCDGKVHCPFCDTDHFKPTKPTRVRDHLELLHMSYAVQAEDLIIVKCFWNCGQTAGHYHCPYCPSKLLKRYAFTLHLYTHMHKLGKDKSCIVVPDPKNPTTIKGLGPEIHLCKKEECYKDVSSNNENTTESSGDSGNNTEVKPKQTLSPSNIKPEEIASTSTTTNENNSFTDSGPHYHCPLCNLICKRRSPLINHLWRCKERPRSSQPVIDENWKKAINPDLYEANRVPHPRDVEGIKYHISIVRTLNDLPMTKCYSPDCDCGHKFHCPLCVEDRFKPNYLCHLQLHYYAHWKRRVAYKDYSVLLCNSWCELKAGSHKVRYHFHCPICGATRRRRKGFAHHLQICNGHPRPSYRRSNALGLNEEPAPTSSAVEEEEEEGEEEGLEEEEILGLDEQFTTDLMMVRDEEAEEEEDVGKGGGGDSKEIDNPVAEENEVEVEMEVGDEDSTNKIDLSKKTGCHESIKDSGDAKSPNAKVDEIVELSSRPQTETTLFTKEELYDEVSARLSLKCVDAFREKGNVDEIFSSIALRTGAEWSCAPATLDSLSVHKFVGDLKALASTRDLLFKTLVGDVTDDQVSSGLTEKETNPELTTQSNLKKTQVMDASVQVEDPLSFPISQPSVRNTKHKSAILNKKSVRLPSSVAAMKPASISPARRKRGRPRKVLPPSEIADSTNLENGAKERNVINVEVSSPDSSHSPTTDNLRANSDINHSPKKRGRPRKIFINKPVAKDMLTDSLMNENKEVNSGIAEAITPNEEMNSEERPEKRKRGRPRKDKTLQDLDQSALNPEGKQQSVDISVQSPFSDPISPDGSSTPKRYSTRGKKIDFSFLTGKNKKEDVDKLETEDGLVCLKKTKVQSSHVLLQNSAVSVKRDLFEKDNDSHQSGADVDNGNTILKTGRNSVSKRQVKKNGPRSSSQPLIMSDVALLPTIRVDIAQRRGQKKTKSLKNKGIRTLVKSSLSPGAPAAAAASEKALLTPGGESSFSLSDSNTTNDLKLISGVESEGLHCHLCKLKGERFDEITDHIKIVHGIEKPLRCDVCERTFEKLFDLRSHVNRKHGPFPQMDTVNCFKCGKVFQGSAKLNWHLSFIHKITREPTPKKTIWPCNQWNDSKLCNLCGKVFSKGNHLVTHIQAVHTKEKAAQCSICNKKFNHIRYLRTHMKRHEGIKKHQCPTCGWRFFESNTLKDHMETHKEASKRRYRFTCDYCGQKYISKANFSDHLNKHTGEKPHKCQVCGKGFAFRTMLMKHQIHIHTTEKPFKCTYCERAFKFKAKLLQHTVIHTGVSKYVCHSCNKPFSCAATLKHHQPRCRGVASWVQNKTVVNEGLTLMVDELALEQQENQQHQETPDTVEIPVEDQSDIVIDMSGLSGMPEGSILQAAAQAAQLMEIPEVFMCSECNAVFSSLSDAEEHVTSFHTDVVAVASTGVVEGAINEIKVMDEEPASSDYIDTTMTAESGST